jgi:hypothetical protein
MAAARDRLVCRLFPFVACSASLFHVSVALVLCRVVSRLP